MPDTLKSLKSRNILSKYVVIIIFATILIISLYYYKQYQYYNIEVNRLQIRSINPVIMDDIYFDDKWGMFGLSCRRAPQGFPEVFSGGGISMPPTAIPVLIETSWYDPFRQKIYKVTLQDPDAPLKARQFLKKQPVGTYKFTLIVVVRDETLEMWLRGYDFHRSPNGGVCLTLLSQQKAAVVEGDKKEYAGEVKGGIKNGIFPADTPIPE